MKNIVEKDWLNSRLDDDNLVVVDCRFSLSDSYSGKMAYTSSHIPGAVYGHLEENLSGPVLAHGGRHPLPDLETFRNFLENAGISNESIVVAYDNGEGAFASRLWWLMKYVGHEKVFVLNGGFKEWEAAGYPLEAEIPKPLKGHYVIHTRPQIMASYEEVKSIVDQETKKAQLVDSREAKRYLGLEEPIDRIPGRIPGAMNKFWGEGLENGRFKALHEQLKRFRDLKQDESIIVYCGSGVTATPNYLVLDELGFPNIKLYVGSYSDWVSYKDNKVESN